MSEKNKMKTTLSTEAVYDLKIVESTIKTLLKTQIMKQNVASQILEAEMASGDYHNYPNRSNNIHRYQAPDGSTYHYVGQPSQSMSNILFDNMQDGILRIPDTYSEIRGYHGIRIVDVTVRTTPMPDGSCEQVFTFVDNPDKIVTMKEVNNCPSLIQVHELFLDRFYEPAMPASPTVELEPEIPKTYKDKLEDTRDIDL